MKTMMYLMPIMFLGFFNSFSSGLSYYYLLANLFTFAQMFFIRRMVNEDKLHARIQENKKKPVVKSGFQNHGIGRILMDKMQEWATAKGATSIELHVYEFNETAVSFYERLGYQTFSRKMSKEIKKALGK